MKVAVIVFPGSNCDRDAVRGVELAGGEAELVWHERTDLGGADAVILPGGFAHGDYVRAGAIARFSPVMGAVRDHAERGGLTLGICNGFQVLTEARLLPGVLRRNTTLRFEHRWVRLGVERRDTPFTHAVPEELTLRVPIAHGEGAYWLPDADLDDLEAKGQVLFRYVEPEGNPNGSERAIAGVTNERGNVAGLMPHPERASELLLGSDDGLWLMRSLVESLAQNQVAA